MKLMDKTFLDMEVDLYNNMISKDLDIIEFRFVDLGKTDYLENDFIISLRSKEHGSENQNKNNEIKKKRK